jgi:hypothetical protein
MPYLQHADDATHDCVQDIQTRDGQLVCEQCAPGQYLRCEGCQQWHPDGESCRDCVTCEHCDDVVAQDETVDTVDGYTICRYCQDESYWQCTGCDGWNRDGEHCGNGCDPDECDCEDCQANRNFGGLVYEYSYKPVPVFHGTGPLYLGPEIEIETPYSSGDACARIARSHLGSLGYLKEDSSIDNGFEIVTHPMSYEWALEHFPWRMLTELDDAGCAATSDTGLHIHLSRNGFSSTCHTYRWMKFIHRNQPQVTTLAGRASAQWAAFTDHDRRAVKDYAKGATGDRYRAINTNNDDTFELRIFASSLDPQRVRALFGFAAASVEYTRGLTVDAIIKRRGWAWPAFVDWVAERPIYAPLHGQLEVLACAC